MRKPSRIIITGSTGFIGSALIKALRVRSHLAVIAPSTRLSERTKLARMLCEGDTVVHLACSTTPAGAEQNRQKDVEENIIGTLNLLDACIEKKIAKFIFASSGGTVYGKHSKHPIKESDPIEPQGAYGAMKLAIEKYIGVYGHLYNMPFTIVRIANPYGRKIDTQRLQGSVDVFLRKIVNGERIEVWGNGNVVRDYIHIDDVLEFFVRAIEKPSIAGIYNLGTGRGASLKEVIRLIEKTTRRKALVKYTPKRNFDLGYNILNISKAKATGWKPRYTLTKGIEKLYLEQKIL